jgi:diacylglycerol kinase (ATP)
VLSGRDEAESVLMLAAAAEDVDAVVVCGGDGIVHLAVNALAESATPLGIIPAGSGNDTAAAIGMDPDPMRAAEQVLAALAAGSTRRIDLGYSSSIADPAASGRWWVSMLYAGFDSAVNERANRMTWPRGKRRYDVAIAVELLRLRSRDFTVTLDGQAMEVPLTLVAVGNGPHYGGGKRMTPDAELDDGLFDITVVAPVSRVTLANLAPKLPRAGHIGHPAVTQYRAKEVQLSAAGTIAYADGERLGPLPIRTRCVPSALSVLVPPVGATTHG